MRREKKLREQRPLKSESNYPAEKGQSRTFHFEKVVPPCLSDALSLISLLRGRAIDRLGQNRIERPSALVICPLSAPFVISPDSPSAPLCCRLVEERNKRWRQRTEFYSGVIWRPIQKAGC
jgi:hypothetical protein